MFFLLAGLSWAMASYSNRSRVQDRLVEWIEANGGSVSYHELNENGITNSIASRLGKGWVFSIRNVNLRESKIEDVSQLSNLTQLEELWLSEETNDISALNADVSLRVLSIPTSKDVVGLSKIAGFEKLEELHLGGQFTNDLSFKKLEGLKILTIGTATREEEKKLNNWLPNCKVWIINYKNEQ